jgi:hypothetical protein
MSHINPRLQDGDAVQLTKPARVDGYWHDPIHAQRGCWDRLFLLPGATGRVIHARTLCVTQRKGEPHYFANVDIKYMGQTHRVRVFHNCLRRVTGADWSQA